MKKVAFVLVLALGFALPAAFGQSNDDLNHVDLGIFADVYHNPATANTFAGVGARAGFNVHPNVQLEAEMNYDFEKVFTETCNDPLCFPATNRTGTHLLTGLFGFKIQKTGNIRPYLTMKGGFINFSFSAAPVTWGTFGTSVSGLRQNNVNGAFYPGGGIELFKGPIGVRFEVGDLIWFNNGPHNGIRFTAGPQFRF